MQGSAVQLYSVKEYLIGHTVTILIYREMTFFLYEMGDICVIDNNVQSWMFSLYVIIT